MPLFLYPVSNDRLMIAEVQILGQFFIYIKRGKLFFKITSLRSQHSQATYQSMYFERLNVMSGLSEQFFTFQKPQTGINMSVN